MGNMCGGERESAVEQEKMKKRRDLGPASECGRQNGNSIMFSKVGTERAFNPGWHKSTTSLKYCSDTASFGGDSNDFAQHAFGFKEKYEGGIKLRVDDLTPTHVSKTSRR